ncbi:hypothetical protein BCR44DRAFT_1438197 [Catenaria anguillulae PL171]|uniref:Uncharacterized protein n=1 Tax=Catenaria anguillulae PL171 TaxID=765915 RepID=A0A1Y2HI53_9FUNG|nr:hypothetical protein BCR44DRAFT_1438197 [Catenaria anguillulae PL171]
MADASKSKSASAPPSPAKPNRGTSASPQKSNLPDIPHHTQVEGIPIAAKFKGPGPVYSLPPTIGINAKYIGQRAPAFSFGVKIPLKAASIGPGPAAFSPRGGFKKVRSDGRAVIFHANPNAGPAEVDLDNPGPAKYQVTATNSVVPRAPAYTITSRPPPEKPPAIPGPAAYCPPTSVGMKQITVASSPAPTIAPGRTVKMEDKSPGPAAYQPVSPNKLGLAPPAYSLGRRWDKDSELGYDVAKTIPGPGAYNPTLRNKSAAPMYSFRQKHSEYEHFVPDDESGNGPLIL